jgi:hypothetical protein
MASGLWYKDKSQSINHVECTQHNGYTRGKLLHEYVWHVFCTRHYLSVKIQSSLAQTNSGSQIYLEGALEKFNIEYNIYT